MRRGQSALEFIMTYGWAVMVLLVMIGALTYMGVVNPQKLLPEKCLFTTGFACKDHKISQLPGAPPADLKVQFAIENAMGKPILYGPVNVSTLTGKGAVCTGVPTSAVGVGTTTYLECTITDGSPGLQQVMKLVVNMSYTTIPGTYSHFTQGEISGTVQ
jgi:hypothetical protein